MEPTLLASKIREEITARRGTVPDPDPKLLSLDTSTSVGAILLEIRAHLFSSPTTVIPATSAALFANGKIGGLLGIDSTYADSRLAALYYPESFRGILQDSEALTRAILSSLLTGNIPNAFNLCKEALLLHSHGVEDSQVRDALKVEIQNFRESGAATEKDREYLDLLYQYLDQGGVFNIIEQRIPISAPQSAEYQDFARRITAELGLRAPDILGKISEEKYTSHRQVVEVLLELARDRKAQLFRCMPKDVVESALDKVLELVAAWGPEAWGFFKAHGKRAFLVVQQHTEAFKRLAKRLEAEECDDDFGVTVGAIPEEALTQFPSHVNAVIAAARHNHHHAFSGLSISVYKLLSPELVSVVARRGGNYAGAIFDRIHELYVSLALPPDPEATAQFNEFLAQTLPCLSDQAARFLYEITPALYHSERNMLIHLAQQRGKAAWKFLKRYGSEALVRANAQAAPMKEMRDAFGTQSTSAIANIPERLWHAAHRLKEQYGSGAGQVFEALGEDFEQTLSASQLMTIEKNRELFNLAALHRYCKRIRGTIDLSLLEDNVANLNPMHRSDRPIAVCLFGRDCHNGALAQQYWNLRRLQEIYKLFIAEVGSTRELLTAVDRFGLLHGQDCSGNALKPIALLSLHAHGYRESIGFRSTADAKAMDRSIDGPELLSEHQAAIASHRPMIHEAGLVIVGSCEAAFGGRNGTNPFSIISEAWLGVRTIAVRRASFLDRLVQGPDGLVRSAKFNCSDRKVVNS